MPPKLIDTRVAKKPTGPFVVVNPRKIPKGRHIIREVKGGKEVGRWFEGDIYDGDKAEHWLERGFIKPGKGEK